MSNSEESDGNNSDLENVVDEAEEEEDEIYGSGAESDSADDADENGDEGGGSNNDDVITDGIDVGADDKVVTWKELVRTVMRYIRLILFQFVLASTY